MKIKHYFKVKRSTTVNRLPKEKKKIEEKMKASLLDRTVDEKEAKKKYHSDDTDELLHLFI